MPRRPLTPADLVRINLPEAYWPVKAGGVQEPARSHLLRYLSDLERLASRGAGLLLWGSPGVGKTAIAAIVVKEARSRGRTGYFTSLFDLRENLRARVAFDETASVLDRCREVDVLVLDNLQASDLTEPFVNLRLVEELVVGRGARKRATLVTTRLSRRELKEHRNDFLDTVEGYLVPLNVAGEDLRKQTAAELKAAVLGKA